MSGLSRKIRLPAACLVCSLLLHLLPATALHLLAPYDLGAPVGPPPAVMVDLALRGAVAVPAASHPGAGRAASSHAPLEPPPAPDPPPARESAGGAAAQPGPTPAGPQPDAPPGQEERVASSTPAAGTAAAPAAETAAPAPAPAGPRRAVAAGAPQPRLRAGDFMTAQHEKLSYLISLHGLPVGSAELEAQHEKGVTTITLRVRSNELISGMFPVDDLVETRHIDGLFIMTRIRQQEGSFRSDEMFTINLGKKRVSWVDFVGNRSLKMAVPTEDVLDTLSGIYYLRNLPLQVGSTETLHIYDSETYAEVPVEILRREELRLPNLTTVATLVVRPLQNTAGIFRRTGEILIWMTDDDHRVPVRIVTSVALGQVTAELVAAESKPSEGRGGVPVASIRTAQ